MDTNYILIASAFIVGWIVGVIQTHNIWKRKLEEKVNKAIESFTWGKNRW